MDEKFNSLILSLEEEKQKTEKTVAEAFAGLMKNIKRADETIKDLKLSTNEQENEVTELMQKRKQLEKENSELRTALQAYTLSPTVKHRDSRTLSLSLPVEQ